MGCGVNSTAPIAEVLGRDLRLSGRPHTIVGVMPPEFNFVNPDVRLWTPLAFTPEQKQVRHSNNWYNIGRLGTGATLEQAQAQVDALNAANLDEFPALRQLLIDARFHTKVLPLQEMVVGDVKNVLYLLWGGALLVLLIGALNIANLALVRLTLRRKELATRQALGARGSQAMRQFILENVLAALAGGVAGVGLGAGLLLALKSFGLEQIPRAAEIQMDAGVAVFALALAGLAGFLIGCAPLAQTFSREPQSRFAGRWARRDEQPADEPGATDARRSPDWIRFRAAARRGPAARQSS